jgi:hypothetical protein
MSKNLSGETGEESESFDVQDEYESLLIQLNGDSSSGSATIELEDPYGEIVYTKEISGEGEVNEEDSLDYVKGVWRVHYTYEDFTADLTIQISGS